MKRVGLHILVVIATMVMLLFCFCVDFLALFSKRVRKYKEQQDIEVSYMHAD